MNSPTNLRTHKLQQANPHIGALEGDVLTYDPATGRVVLGRGLPDGEATWRELVDVDMTAPPALRAAFPSVPGWN